VNQLKFNTMKKEFNDFVENVLSKKQMKAVLGGESPGKCHVTCRRGDFAEFVDNVSEATAIGMHKSCDSNGGSGSHWCPPN
jgi:natural product precursor